MTFFCPSWRAFWDWGPFAKCPHQNFSWIRPWDRTRYFWILNTYVILWWYISALWKGAPRKKLRTLHRFILLPTHTASLFTLSCLFLQLFAGLRAHLRSYSRTHWEGKTICHCLTTTFSWNKCWITTCKTIRQHSSGAIKPSDVCLAFQPL